MLVDRLHVSIAAFAAGTGWKVQPQGACKGELCVPLAPGSFGDNTVDVTAVAERLGMAVVPDAATGRWAIGPETFSGKALATTEAPDLQLETFDGQPFALSSLRGTRTVVVAWAPY
ncbi:MAG: hypothetical protein ACKV2O_09580 [Acidimicrobiales bacterium]